MVGRFLLLARILSIELDPSQVEGGPDDVEEGEEDEAEVLQELGAAAQEELQARPCDIKQHGDLMLQTPQRDKNLHTLLTQTRNPTRAGMQRAVV